MNPSNAPTTKMSPFGYDSSLEASLSILDLEDAPEAQQFMTPQKQKHMEHSQVFEELVQGTAEEYANEVPRPLMTRQASARVVSSTRNTEKPKGRKLPRRHSSYEPHQQCAIFQAHQDMKEAIEQQSRDTSSIITSLMEFNLSVNMASLSDLSLDKSPALHYSCPVLSYMNDDDEDSVELLTFKRGLKRNSNNLSVLKEETDEQRWEMLDDDDDGLLDLTKLDGKVTSNRRNTHNRTSLKADYMIAIKQLEEDEKPRTKRRKSSCKYLSERLSNEHPQRVLRSLQGAC
jgi:hypothetical protein